jgi:hypothetical protein
MYGNNITERNYVIKQLKFTAEPPKVATVAAVSKWETIVNRLRRSKKNHGLWAKVAKNVQPSTATKLKKDFPEVQWVVRKNAQNGYDLWASYSVVQDSSEQPEPTTHSWGF